MAHTSCLCLLVLTLSSACATEAPWKATDPNERVLIPAADISDAELAGLDVPYEHYDGKLGRGYLVEKGSLCRSAGSDLDNQLK